MLFGYPVDAIQENWLHDCLIELLETVRDKIQAGQPIPGWEEILSANCRDKLLSRVGLRDRLNLFVNDLALLQQADIDKIFKAMIEQNEVITLLSGNSSCSLLTNLPAAIHQSLKDFFHFAFKDLLTGFGIRDRQYQIIYDQISKHICPFCGLEYFTFPGEPREDLDHYLKDSEYVFASVNLSNLVPMGSKCNKQHKHAQDIIRDNVGAFRKAFYPYSQIELSINLDKSELFSGDGDFLPQWVIEFEPNLQEVSTWDNVFHIRQRYAKILNEKYKPWLRNFRSWFISTENQLPQDHQELLNLIEKYLEYLKQIEENARDILNTAFFGLIFEQLQLENGRLKDLLLNTLSE